MLKFNTVRITHRPWMDIPLEYPQLLLEADTNGFDYTGFNLVPLEIEYYKRNEIELISSKDTYTGLNINNHWPLKQPWLVVETKNPNLFVNNSYMYTRYGYTGRARYEIEKYLKWNSQLARLLQVKPKWALSMEIEWIDERGCFNLLNFYKEYQNTDYMKYDIQLIKYMLAPFNWERDCKMLADLHTEWKNLNFSDQDTYKRSYFGLTDV